MASGGALSAERRVWLGWSAPPECQNTSEVERRLESLLGHAVDFEAIPATRVRMAWTAEQGWSVRVSVALDSGTRDRSLDAPSCADALDVVALTMALILEPDFQPSESESPDVPAEEAPSGLEPNMMAAVLDPAASGGDELLVPRGTVAEVASVTAATNAQHEKPSEPQSATFAVGGGALADLSTFPVPQFGGGLVVGLRDGSFRAEVEGNLLASESAGLRGAEQRVSFASLVGAVRTCYGPTLTARFAWVTCIGAELGSLSTHELGGAARNTNGLWLATQLLTGPEFSATDWLRAFAYVRAVTPLIRHEFFLSEGSRVHELPWVGLQLQVGFSADVTELGGGEH